MILEYRQENIFNGWDNDEINAIAHQCNCVSRNVQGIAQSMFVKFPFLGDEHYTYIEDNPNCFGTILVKEYDNKWLVNMYSQYYPSFTNNKDFIQNGLYYKDNMDTRLNALKKCLHNIYSEWISNYNQYLYLGIPLVASGLGADLILKQNLTDLEYFKKYIEPVINEVYDNCDLTLIVYHL